MVSIGDTFFLRSDTQNIFYRRHFFNRHRQFIISKNPFQLQTILFHRQAKKCVVVRWLFFISKCCDQNFMSTFFRVLTFKKNMSTDAATANMRLKASGDFVLIWTFKFWIAFVMRDSFVVLISPPASSAGTLVASVRTTTYEF